MKTKPNSGIEALKRLVREPYVWPGGYPKFAIMGDGEALCKSCAKSEFKRIVADTMQGFDKSFQVVGVDVNWENHNLFCCHCGDKIEAAYGDD